MKKIIHPTDFSENASKALKFAIGLSKKFDAELIILNVEDFPTIMNSSSSVSSFTEMEEEKIASITKNLKKYVGNSTNSLDANSKIHYSVKFNSSTADGIIEAINETDADMTVVGTKGQSIFKEAIVGSTTKALVLKAPCPILAIPEEANFDVLKHIIYASDFNQHDIIAITRLVPIAEIYNAELSIVHIYKDESSYNSEATNFRKNLSYQVKYPHLNYETLVSDDLAKSLVSYLNNKNADLLVMFEKDNTGISRLFHKDMVKQFAEHSTVPLMSFNSYSIHIPKED